MKAFESVTFRRAAHGVAVIIPCYNSAHLLGEAIQSVLDQTYGVAEIVVVDDGSSDGIATALSGYAPHVQLMRQANQGPAAARNAGIRLTALR
jgi:glycosyltransferase involved in cell wall biosynthesis